MILLYYYVIYILFQNKILKIVYVWVLCRDMEELNPQAAWKILEVSSNAQELWL